MDASEVCDSILSHEVIKLIRNKLSPIVTTICSGKLCIANTCRNASMVLAVVLQFISITSGHFKNASTITRENLFKMVLQSRYGLMTMACLATAMGVGGFLVVYSLFRGELNRNLQASPTED